MLDALAPQHGLYTVVERRARGDRPRVIGVMRRYLLAPENPGLVVRALAARRTRLVTLTVTDPPTTSTRRPWRSTARTPSLPATSRRPRRPPPPWA
jgi:mannitol-1-phosphate/altronate dehydrogenase